jgi:hypothetical protein
MRKQAFGHVMVAAALVALAACGNSSDVNSGAGSGGFVTQPVAASGTRVGFWAGENFVGAPQGTDPAGGTYWAPRDTSPYTAELWSTLGSLRVPVYFQMRYKRDFGPLPAEQPVRDDTLPILRQAQQAGVPLWAWLIVPYSDGYFATGGNAQEQFDAVRELQAWAQRNGILFQGVALDLEPPYQTFANASSAISGISAILASIEKNLDPAAQCQAMHTYESIVAWANSRNISITGAPMPFSADDLVDGHLALQNAFDYIVAPAGWHALYFQAYRSTIGQFVGGIDPGSGIVSSYFRSAQQYFGKAGQVSLATPGGVGYATVDDMAHDVRMLATLGAGDVPIYSLELALKSYGLDGVRQLAAAAQQPFSGSEARTETAPTAEAEAVRVIFSGLDLTAVAATPLVTGTAGKTQLPNAWPDGCP